VFLVCDSGGITVLPVVRDESKASLGTFMICWPHNDHDHRAAGVIVAFTIRAIGGFAWIVLVSISQCRGIGVSSGT
jgi:hypothetical protein